MPLTINRPERSKNSLVFTENKFWLMKYMTFLSKHKVPALVSLLLLGLPLFSAEVAFASIFQAHLDIVFLASLSLFLFAPYLLHKQAKMLEEMWPKLIEKLDKTGIEKLKKVEELLNSKGYLAVAVPLGAAPVLAIIIPHIMGSTLSLFIVFHVSLWAIIASTGGFAFWAMVHMVYYEWTIGQYEITLNPYDPDGFGGLSFLSNFFIKTTLVSSTGAVVLVVLYDVVMRPDIGRFFPIIIQATLFVTLIYVVIVLAIFAVPFAALHKAAVRGKNKLLEEAAKDCLSAKKEFKHTPNLDKEMQILVSHSLFNHINQIKINPINAEISVKLLLSILLPLGLGTLRIWAPWIPWV